MSTIKKIIVVLAASISINFSVSAQSAGDYRSINSGNWNDPMVWEIYNGADWISASAYPGQNAGTGAVNIMNLTKIKITASVPHPVSAIYVEGGGYFCECSTIEEYNALLMLNGALTFNAQNAISLSVSGSVTVFGELGLNDQEGAKSHSLYIGGSLGSGDMWWDYYYYYTSTIFQTINQDDKLHIIFNTTQPGSIWSGMGISLQEVTFNGIGISLETSLDVKHANFINGIISSNGSLHFTDNATFSGASSASFVQGTVRKSGDDPFTFPIGGGNVYAPLTISAPTNQAASVSARYHRQNASILGTISDPGLVNVSNCEYWELNSNNTILNVTANWSSASGCEPSPYITNVPAVTLAHFNNTSQKWDNHGGSGTGTIANGSVTWNAVNSSGYFTLGNLNACNAPWAVATNITSSSATLNWSATGDATTYDVDYRQINSGVWTHAATATTSTSVNLPGLSSAMVYEWRIRTNCGFSSSTYMLGQFKTLCGIPSALSTGNITSFSATLSWEAVTNASNYNVEYKQSTSTIWLTSATAITSLSHSLSGLSASTGYNWRVLANCYGSGSENYAQSSFTTSAHTVCNDVYESNNTSAQAKNLALGTTISATISSGADVDWFKINTPNEPGTPLKVSLGNLPADYDLYVYNKQLSLVGASTLTGTSNEVVLFNSNARKATYYIKVAGKNGTYNSSQCYNLLTQVNSNPASITSTPQETVKTREELTNLVVYPNPASGFVYLLFNNNIEGFSDVQIFNTAGQLVKRYPVNALKSTNQVRIPIHDIQRGVYRIKITRGELMMTGSFMVMR